MIRVGFVVAGILLAATAALAKEGVPTLTPVGERYKVDNGPYDEEGFRGKEDKDEPGEYKTAKDVSGIACLPGTSEPRRCLVINDQNKEAQRATIADRTITPGAVVPLLGKTPSPAILGAPPDRNDCSGGATDFSDLDGEGVAYAAPYFYVVGSHGCSRGEKLFSLSSFILARVKVDASGAQAPGGLDAVETTYRVSDALAAADIVGSHFAHDLQTDKHSNGLNIEGLAVVGDRLFLGLRAPSLDGMAYILETSVEALFAKGPDRRMAKPAVIPVKIGKDAGIRDLAVLPDKRLLVLTGPAQEQDLPYELFAVETKPGGTVERLAQLDTVEEKNEKKKVVQGKAEAVLPLGGGRLLILFDSLENGGPREYALPN